MKNTKKSSEFEPTLSDVLEAVQTGFGKVEDRFEKIDERFDGVDERLDRVENRVIAIEKRTGSIEITLEDMKETLNGVARAVDKDAITIIDHGRRITHLEKACA